MHAVVVLLVNGLVLKTLEDPMDYKDVERPEKWKKAYWTQNSIAMAHLADDQLI